MTDPAKAGERGKPILFSAPMVRALLAGTKTQTRRIIKPQPPETARYSGIHYASDEPDSHFFNTPHGGIKVRQRIAEGDRLWVRENFARREAIRLPRPIDNIVYRADLPPKEPPITTPITAKRLLWMTAPKPWRPSIHMPRWASRLTLIVTDVRVQRLQDISEEDARSEGAGLYVPGHGFITEDELRADPGYSNFLDPRLGFEAVWNEINGAGSWDANPWVAAYSFEVHHQNIDAMPLPAARDAAMKEGG